jgi:toluene monooxygenase system ferredoxin subunit
MTWIPICPVKSVDPGEMQVVDVEEKRFLVLKGNEGESLVIPPICPHMNADLCDGFFDGEVLTCSKHLWQWSVKDGSKLGIAEAPLLVYPSREVAGNLEVDFKEELRYGHEEE